MKALSSEVYSNMSKPHIDRHRLHIWIASYSPTWLMDVYLLHNVYCCLYGNFIENFYTVKIRLGLYEKMKGRIWQFSDLAVFQSRPVDWLSWLRIFSHRSLMHNFGTVFRP